MPLAMFLLVGMGITIASAGSYWLLAGRGGLDPNLSLLLVFVVFTLIGFVAHGRITFGDHARSGGSSARLVRYVVVSLSGFIVNELFVFVLVKKAHGAVWWPVVPMILVTPWLLFGLNRFWVFPEQPK